MGGTWTFNRGPCRSKLAAPLGLVVIGSANAPHICLFGDST